MTKEERLVYQRERRSINRNSDTKKYEKTLNGFLMRTYRNMQSRVEGVQHLKQHLYLGKELLSRELFYAFSKSNQQFLELFSLWEHDFVCYWRYTNLKRFRCTKCGKEYSGY